MPAAKEQYKKKKLVPPEGDLSWGVHLTRVNLKHSLEWLRDNDRLPSVRDMGLVEYVEHILQVYAHKHGAYPCQL